MARVRAKKSTAQPTTTGTSITVALPTHVAGDVLVICLGRDNNRENFAAPTGWTQAATVGFGTTSATSNAVRGALYWRVAASSSETNPTFTIVNGDEMFAIALSIEGADTTNPIDVTPVTSTDSTSPATTLPGITTATANALVFQFTAVDSAYTHPPADWITLEMMTAGNIIFGTLVYTVQNTAGVVPATESSGGTSAIITFAIRDGSGGALVPAYPALGSIAAINPLRNATAETYYANLTNDFSRLWNFANDALTLADPTSCWQVQASGPTFVSMLSQATNDTAGDVIPFPATEAINDYFTIGYSSPFSGVLYDRGGSSVRGINGVAGIEYWNGSAWADLTPFDYYDSSSQSGTLLWMRTVNNLGQFARFNPPSNWATLSLNGETADYKIRFRVITLYTTNPTLSRARIILGQATKLIAQNGTFIYQNSGLNYFENAVAIYNAENRPVYYGFLASLFDPVSTLNWSTGLVAFSYSLQGGLNLNMIGTKDDGGFQFGIHDISTGDTISWCVGALETTDTFATDTQIAVIQPGQSADSSWKKTASLPSISNVPNYFFAAYSGIGINRTSLMSRVIYIPSTIQFAGGGASYPITWDRLLEIAYFYDFPIINVSSGVAIAPIQFGGGRKIHLDISQFSLSFPAQATKTNRFTKSHVDEGYLGVVIDGRAGDVVRMTSGSITGRSKIRFEMLATCSASATYNFRGLTVINANVTMRPVMTFAGMQFINCTTFAQNQTDFSGCSFTGSTISCDKLSGFEDCAFACASEHALVLGPSQIGTHTFYGNTFTGYGADGTTTAAIYNNSGGAVTIQLSAGDVVPTVRNGAGATTNVVLSAAYTISGLVAGSRLLIRRTDTQAVLLNETVAGTSRVYTYNYTADIPVEIVARKATGSPAYQEWRTTATLTSAGGAATANQQLDE